MTEVALSLSLRKSFFPPSSRFKVTSLPSHTLPGFQQEDLSVPRSKISFDRSSSSEPSKSCERGTSSRIERKREREIELNFPLLPVQPNSRRPCRWSDGVRCIRAEQREGKKIDLDPSLLSMRVLRSEALLPPLYFPPFPRYLWWCQPIVFGL